MCTATTTTNHQQTMKNLVRVSTLIVLMSGSTLLPAAGVIGVNFTPSGSEMDYVNDFAGAPGARVHEWNNAVVGGGNTTFD